MEESRKLVVWFALGMRGSWVTGRLEKVNMTTTHTHTHTPAQVVQGCLTSVMRCQCNLPSGTTKCTCAVGGCENVISKGTLETVVPLAAEREQNGKNRDRKANE